MRPRNDIAQQSFLRALRQGPASASSLSQRAGVVPRTILRWLGERQDILQAGAGPRARYALQRPLRGRLEKCPLYRVDEHGGIEEVASLAPVYPDGVLCNLQTLSWPVDSTSIDGWWEGLPYPLLDMRPQGFLGRTFARQYHAALEIPPDPRQWSDDDVLYILTRAGWDTSGNLILGEPALQRWQERVLNPEPAITEAQQPGAYIALARGVAALGVAGGSAGGEFPKFPAIRRLAGAATEHVIVKFSGEVSEGATQRWSDLLVCEHLASVHIAKLPGVAGARSRILRGQNRTFLESERFDRVGRFGRTPLVSLESLNNHMLGTGGEDWRVPVRRMAQLKLIAPAGADSVLRMWWFGKLIANSDMHMGNLSFIPEAGTFRIAPAYDMLPMAYAPLPGGEVPAVAPQFSMPLPAERSAWMDAYECALAFWEDAGSDERISGAFRAICRENARQLATIRGKVIPR